MAKAWHAVAAAEAARLYPTHFYYRGRGTELTIGLVEGDDAVAESVSRRKLPGLPAEMDHMSANLQAKGVERLATAAHAPKGGHAVLVALFRAGLGRMAAEGQAWRDTFFSKP